MAGIQRYTQDTGEIVSYPVDVVGLGSNTITTSTTLITPAGMTVVSDTIVGSRVYALISGGVEGTSYRVRTRIVISNGEARVNKWDISVTNLV